uniref:THAP domain-containing protein 1 n=1 Tax=Acanthochromis polyacanthus TaxID=80966 RepID=A0A3Q1FKD8_9TELE
MKRRLAYQRVGASALYCCVPLCTVSSRCNSEVSFHSFPVDSVVRAQWLQKIRRDNFTPTKSTRVCRRHFKPDEFYVTAGGLRKLKKGAIPLYFDASELNACMDLMRMCAFIQDLHLTDI